MLSHRTLAVLAIPSALLFHTLVIKSRLGSPKKNAMQAKDSVLQHRGLQKQQAQKHHSQWSLVQKRLEADALMEADEETTGCPRPHDPSWAGCVRMPDGRHSYCPPVNAPPGCCPGDVPLVPEPGTLQSPWKSLHGCAFHEVAKAITSATIKLMAGINVTEITEAMESALDFKKKLTGGKNARAAEEQKLLVLAKGNEGLFEFLREYGCQWEKRYSEEQNRQQFQTWMNSLYDNDGWRLNQITSSLKADLESDLTSIRGLAAGNGDLSRLLHESGWKFWWNEGAGKDEFAKWLQTNPTIPLLPRDIILTSILESYLTSFRRLAAENTDLSDLLHKSGWNEDAGKDEFAKWLQTNPTIPLLPRDINKEILLHTLGEPLRTTVGEDGSQEEWPLVRVLETDNWPAIAEARLRTPAQTNVILRQILPLHPHVHPHLHHLQVSLLQILPTLLVQGLPPLMVQGLLKSSTSDSQVDGNR